MQVMQAFARERSVTDEIRQDIDLTSPTPTTRLKQKLNLQPLVYETSAPATKL